MSSNSSTQYSEAFSQITNDNVRKTFLLKRMISGELKQHEIKSFTEYSSLYRLRHDMVHWIICQEMGYNFGEKHIREIIPPIEHKNWDLIKEQSPDIFVVDGKMIKMIEITISSSYSRERQKYAKYSMLIKVLETEYNVDYKVMMFSVKLGTLQFNRMKTEYNLSDEAMDRISTVLRNFGLIIRNIHSTRLGMRWYNQFHEISDQSPDFKIEEQDIINYYKSVDRKPFNDIDDLIDVMNSDPIDGKESEKFLDDICKMTISKIGDLSSTLYSNDDPDEAIRILRNHHLDNHTRRDFRHFMPTPKITSIYDINQRDVDDDEKRISVIQNKLIRSGDAFLCEFANNLEGFYCDRRKISRETRRLIAIEGPGRKRYIRDSEVHKVEQKKYTGYWLPLVEKYDQRIKDLTFEFSKIYNRDDVRSNDDLLSMNGPGLSYAMVVQEIFREININSLRADRRRNHMIKPTNIPGIYVILAAGAKLRTGLKPSTIWYKIVIINDENLIDVDKHSMCFMSLNIDNGVRHSSWLSVDADRLDHYLRAVDKIKMAYLSYIHGSCDILANGVRIDRSNTLGTIILIYMEDKRSTSKMLQDVRYVVMNTLSLSKFWSKMITKFTDPIRTPLQLYLLNKIVNYIRNSKEIENLAVKSASFGKPVINPSTSGIDDRFSGMRMKIRRILTDGPEISFEQILCEMYFTMLFNKNQDDSTHSSFQILKKIVEGEDNLMKVKASTNLHTGYQKGVMSDAEELIFNPKLNQFSRKAIEVGSYFQSFDDNNEMQNGNAHYTAARRSNMNKRMEEFATFKSSSITKNLHFTLDAYIKKYRTIDNKMIHDVHEIDRMRRENELVLIEQTVQNPRRRCLEGALELANDGFTDSYSLVSVENLSEDNCFQIFKKNQIGGVREILILTIKKRILINILETYSRNICSFDQREMMTSGRKKFTLMTSIMKRFKQSSTKSLNINYNSDKTKWGPTFMPIQFLYLFTPYKNINRSLFLLIMFQLINHTNKKCLFPEELIRVWKRHPDKLHKNQTEYLQKYKDDFLYNGKQYLTNESNMGQGILHYTSSYLHLCLLSFRNRLYEKYCDELKLIPCLIKDLVSSDDSLTVQNVPIQSKMKTILHIKLLSAAQVVSERLFNCRTSKSKSSISALIFEFNSMFGSNLTLYPTLFKFALSSVQPVNTDSFFRMVKESYNTARQIIENGGSVELYMIAQKMNKRFCEHVYHTQPEGRNNFSSLRLRRKFIPYHLGVYPILDPNLMIMLGPESWNYRILDNFDQLTNLERNLFLNCHKMVDIKDPSVIAELDSVDNLYVGLQRIEAKMGPVSKLLRIRRRFVGNIMPTMNRILENPMCLFRKSQTQVETQDKIKLKLYQNSAAEALRSTAFSIYYGRYGASATGESYHLPFTEMEKTSYLNCLLLLLEKPIEEENEMMTKIESYYPFQDEYRRIERLKFEFVNWESRNPYEVRTLHSLQLVKASHVIVNPISQLLERFWYLGTEEKTPNSMFRDWSLLKEGFPILEDTLEDTLNNIKGDKEKQIRQLILMILRMMGHLHKPMKMVGYGESSRSIEKTTQMLSVDNRHPGMTVKQKDFKFKSEEVTMVFDFMNMVFNIYVMNKYERDRYDISTLVNDLSDETINNFCMTNSISYASKKKVFIMLLEHDKIEDIAKWTARTRTIFHQWEKKQIKRQDFYAGSASLILQQGNIVVNIKQRVDGRIAFYSNDTGHRSIVGEILIRGLELLQLNERSLERIIDDGSIRKGKFILSDGKLIQITENRGFHIYLRKELQPINISPGISTIDEENMMIQLDDRTTTNTIMRTHLGMLPVNINVLNLKKYHLENAEFFGIRLEKILSSGCMADEFNLSSLSSSNKIDILDDLKLNSPKISNITKSRLSKVIDFNERKMVVMNLPEGLMETKMKEMDMMTEDDLIMDLMGGDDVVVKSYTSINDITSSQFDWMSVDSNVALLSNIRPLKVIYQSTKILKRLIGLKYHIIASLLVHPSNISSSTIKVIYNICRNENVLNALVYVYNELYTTTDEPSPNLVSIEIDPEFNKKYIKLF